MLLYVKLLSILLCLNLDKVTASSEGRSFAFVFPQARSDIEVGACEIYVLTKQRAEVTIYEPDGGTDTFSVSQNSAIRKTYDYSYRIIDYVQTKGFIIEADTDISVMLSNYRDDGHMDTALVPPVEPVEHEYMIVSFPSIDEFTCATYSTCSFYTVTAYEDETYVYVYRMMQGYPRLLDREFLNKHQVLTNRTLHTPDDRHYDLTGYYVVADKAVSVSAGNGCGNTDIRRTGSMLWSSMCPVEQAGTRYISHTLNYRGFSGPTLVKIVALSNDTQVNVTGSSDIINYIGEYLQYTLSSDETVVFECDKLCLAAQYSVNNIGVTPGGSAAAMAMLIPTDKFADSVVFAKPEVGSPTTAVLDYLSLVYLTETPDESPLFYDGNALSGWTIHSGEGFSSLEIEVSGNRNVVHSVISTPEGPTFSALIHGHGDDSKGYAYIAGYGRTD